LSAYLLLLALTLFFLGSFLQTLRFLLDLLCARAIFVIVLRWGTQGERPHTDNLLAICIDDFHSPAARYECCNAMARRNGL
jgi:hypothetical protein